jgi:hypothetical protein
MRSATVAIKSAEMCGSMEFTKLEKVERLRIKKQSKIGEILHESEAKTDSCDAESS